MNSQPDQTSDIADQLEQILAEQFAFLLGAKVADIHKTSLAQQCIDESLNAIRQWISDGIGSDESLRPAARYEVAPGTKYFEVPDNATFHANFIRQEIRKNLGIV